MAKKAKAAPPPVEAPKEEASPDIENWADKPDSDLYEKCLGYYDTIVKAYENRDDADQAIAEYWHIYNAEPDDNQMYAGNSKCYIPAVRDALGARTKRAVKQLFPSKYKHVEAVGTDGQKPSPQLSLLEHYIRKTKLKSLCRSTLVAGDVTGQWNWYIDWKTTKHSVTNMIRRNPPLADDLEASDPTEQEDTLEDDEVVDSGPEIIDFAAEDLVVIPATVNNIAEAHITCIKLRMSKDRVQELIDDGIFIVENDTELSEWIADHKGTERQNPAKKRVQDAGIKTEGALKYALIFEAHVYLKFPKDEHTSLVYIYYANENEILGIIRAPQWGQKRPILSAPVERVSGSFNGVSKVEPVKFLQWNLNDFWNMGQDSAQYSMLPIIMTNPESNPNYAMMVYGLAAVWPVDPNNTKAMSFPQLWKDSMGICQGIKEQIWQSLDVNDSMMGKAPAGRKNNQAVGAQQQEQSVAILDHAERFEEEMLTPLMERLFEYDAQFRDEDVTILTQGAIGVQAQMQKIPPQQWGERYFFQWVGTAFVASMQQMQQQTAVMNVLRGIPPQQLNGRKLDITPILEMWVENVFGAELGARVLIDDRNKYSVPAEIEDEMMVNGIPIEVHEADDDAQHLQVHMKAGAATGDPAGLIRTHMQAHMGQMQKKRQMQMAQEPGSPGVPGGGAAPGVAGTPRIGAQPAPQRPGGQQPPGAIHADQMLGQPGRG